MKVNNIFGIVRSINKTVFMLISFTVRREKNQCNYNGYVIMNPALIALVQHSHEV